MIKYKQCSFHFIEGVGIIFMLWKAGDCNKYEQIVNMPENEQKMLDFRILDKYLQK